MATTTLKKMNVVGEQHAKMLFTMFINDLFLKET
jgi:hypothetical protein